MKKIFFIVFFLSLLLIFKKFFLPIVISRYIISSTPEQTIEENPYFIDQTKKVTSTVIPTKVENIPTIIPESNPVIENKESQPIDDGQPWGVSQQISEHTWVIKVGQDSQMATPQQILTALNDYRIKHGSQPLAWDETLSNYANSRADFFFTNKKLDSHQGFSDFLNNDNGFEKLGFTALGENASLGYRLTGTHLIEWVYAGDEPHDKNQLDNRWSNVGIGVVDTATCLIFATGKM
jgi:uncharacterized protein YkwD